MMQNFGRLPSELDEQDPRDFLRAVNAMTEMSEKQNNTAKLDARDVDISSIPAGYRAFYGG